eukprot:488958-Pleurochrysis_carterae.AAC.1
MSALERAHAADRKWPHESARQALASRRSAARAKAEACGCVLYDETLLSAAVGARVGAYDRASEGSRDVAPHRISASDNHKRYVGLVLRWRRKVARGCSVACNRCAGACGRCIDRDVGVSRYRKGAVARKPRQQESGMGSNVPRSHRCLAPIAAAAPRAATLRRMEANAHSDS